MIFKISGKQSIFKEQKVTKQQTCIEVVVILPGDFQKEVILRLNEDELDPKLVAKLVKEQVSNAIGFRFKSGGKAAPVYYIKAWILTKEEVEVKKRFVTLATMLRNGWSSVVQVEQDDILRPLRIEDKVIYLLN